MSETIKVSMPSSLSNQVKSRAETLGMTTPEYIRTLASLDVSTHNYQELAIYINFLYNQIIDCHNKLDIHCVAVQDIPIIKLEQISC